MKPDIIAFTDASVTKIGSHCTTGYGYLLLNLKKGVFTYGSEQIPGKMGKLGSSDYGEHYSVFAMLEELQNRGVHNKKIMIVTDYTQAIKTYSRASADAQPVRHTTLYNKVHKIARDNGYTLKFVHIHSHTNSNKYISTKATSIIRRDLDKFNVTGNMDLTSLFIQCNRFVDLCAKAATDKYKKIYKNKKLSIE